MKKSLSSNNDDCVVAQDGHISNRNKLLFFDFSKNFRVLVSVLYQNSCPLKEEVETSTILKSILSQKSVKNDKVPNPELTK